MCTENQILYDKYLHLFQDCNSLWKVLTIIVFYLSANSFGNDRINLCVLYNFLLHNHDFNNYQL